MKIETKANIGDIIFYLTDNRVHSARVQVIKIIIEEKVNTTTGGLERTIIQYHEYKTCHGVFWSGDIFLSKRELAESLIGDEEDKE